MNGAPWSDRDIWRFIALYPDTHNADLAKVFRRSVFAINAMSTVLGGLHKSPALLSSIGRRENFRISGQRFWYAKGHVPANKGLRRPGWSPGRMSETQFKKGTMNGRARVLYQPVGALRLNCDGYVDIKVREAPGARAWQGFHRFLWEAEHGPIPKRHCVRFKDGDRFHLDVKNFELVSLQDNMRRNSIHNLPQPLRSTINVLGQLKRRINEKQDRRSAQSPVRHA